jgi:hypothetical protein
MSRFVPLCKMTHLQAEITGFADESDRIQKGFTLLLWINSQSKRYKHKSVKGAFFLTFEKRNKIFGSGKKFKTANDKIKMFDDSKGWKHHKFVGGESQEYQNKETKAYIITEIGRNAFSSYQCKEIEYGENFMNMMTGTIIRTAPKNAIKSKDSKGKTVKTKMKIPGKVAINIDAIIQAFQYLKQVRDSRLHGSQMPNDNWLGGVFKKWKSLPVDEVDEWLEYRINQLTGLCVLAHSTVAERGFIYQRYEEAQSGRLYSADSTITLQNVAREVRAVALRGHGWDHDFENCHYALFADLAEYHGVECQSIRLYLTNKKTIRDNLAKEIDVDVSKIKEALISLIYGSQDKVYWKAALPGIMGRDKAEELYKTKTYIELRSDIDAGTTAIIDNCSRSNGKLKNAMGKCLSVVVLDKNEKEKPLPVSKQLAHILQGLEAKLLNIVGETNPGKLTVLMHDGFLTKEKLDTDRIVQEIAKQTLSTMGVKIEMEMETKAF